MGAGFSGLFSRFHVAICLPALASIARRNKEWIMAYKVAVVGATGNVGREMLSILAERQFPASEVVALASTARPASTCRSVTRR